MTSTSIFQAIFRWLVLGRDRAPVARRIASRLSGAFGSLPPPSRGPRLADFRVLTGLLLGLPLVLPGLLAGLLLGTLGVGANALAQEAGGTASAPPTAVPVLAAADQPQSDPSEDYYFMSDDIVRLKDGRLLWFYVTNHVGATTLKSSFDGLGIKDIETRTRTRDKWTIPFTQDRDGWGRSSMAQDIKRDPNAPDENVLILVFPPVYKDIVEEFLLRLDVPEPQVFLKAKVVEVSLDSNLEYGVSMFFDRGGGDAATGTPGDANPNAFFRSFRTALRPSSFTNDFMSPENTGLSVLLNDLGMDEGTITAQIEALQERGSANILSEPSIVATQGQIATLVTGQETPYFEVVLSGSNERITTKFKETGIKFDFTPMHIGREFVKLRVRVEVSSVTGYVEATGSATSIQTPVVAQRNSETVVTIRDEMTLVIGGLYAISEVESKAGVPILGDLPVLKYLFSRTKKTRVKSELDFFITPEILNRRLDKGVFVPPGERRRLNELKSRERGAGSGLSGD